MSLPDWRKLTFADGVVPEKITDLDRIVLWVPDGRQKWKRVNSTPNTKIDSGQGICSIPATSVSMKPLARGLFGKLFGKGAETRSWYHPKGQAMEQYGERQTDLLLVWPQDPAGALDEEVIRARWSQCTDVQALADNLYLVFGIEAAEVPSTLSEPLPPEPNQREFAQRLLDGARKRGDVPAEASALTDLGAFLTREGDAQNAVKFLEEAVTLTRRVGDRSRELDALGSLGLAYMHLGHGSPALQCFQQEHSLALQLANRFGLKNALSHLGTLYASAKDPRQGIAYMQQAAAIAREIGDIQGESELLWDMAIQNAELGQRDQALELGQASIALLQKLKKPTVATFVDHLAKFRAGTATALGMPANLGGPVVAGAGQIQPTPATGGVGPSLLRMAFTAARAMSTFVGSGMKTVTADVHKKRLETCGGCEHHTGVRCRVCGCFTTIKARLPHESCPLGKW